MMLSEIIEEVIAEINKHRTQKDNNVLDEIIDSIENKFLVDQKTGCTRSHDSVEISFRGENFKIPREFFRGTNPNSLDYTTTDLDEEMMWRILKAWCDRKRFVSFRDFAPMVDGKVHGYLARDKSGCLMFFDNLPVRVESAGVWDTDCEYIPIDKEILPDLRWEDDPAEVNLLVEQI